MRAQAFDEDTAMGNQARNTTGNLQLGDLIVAAFDEAARHSTNAREVSRLAALAVERLLGRSRQSIASRRKFLMTTNGTHSGDMERQLRQWGEKLDELMAKAVDAGTDAKFGYHRRVDELKEKHHAVELKLAEVRASGSEKWETLKVDVESAWVELELAFKNLTN